MAGLAVLGYAALEGYAAYRNRYRIEPLYIYSQLVSARRATVQCEQHVDIVQFDRNLASLRRRALKDVSENELETRTEELKREIDVMIASDGCESPEIRVQRRRFKIYAGKRAG